MVRGGVAKNFQDWKFVSKPAPIRQQLKKAPPVAFPSLQTEPVLFEETEKGYNCGCGAGRFGGAAIEYTPFGLHRVG
jgi:hypothetical protein